MAVAVNVCDVARHADVLDGWLVMAGAVNAETVTVSVLILP